MTIIGGNDTWGVDCLPEQFGGELPPIMEPKERTIASVWEGGDSSRRALPSPPPSDDSIAMSAWAEQLTRRLIKGSTTPQGRAEMAYALLSAWGIWTYSFANAADKNASPRVLWRIWQLAENKQERRTVEFIVYVMMQRVAKTNKMWTSAVAERYRKRLGCNDDADCILRMLKYDDPNPRIMAVNAITRIVRRLGDNPTKPIEAIVTPEDAFVLALAVVRGEVPQVKGYCLSESKSRELIALIRPLLLGLGLSHNDIKIAMATLALGCEPIPDKSRLMRFAALSRDALRVWESQHHTLNADAAEVSGIAPVKDILQGKVNPTASSSHNDTSAYHLPVSEVIASMLVHAPMQEQPTDDAATTVPRYIPSKQFLHLSNEIARMTALRDADTDGRFGTAVWAVFASLQRAEWLDFLTGGRQPHHKANVGKLLGIYRQHLHTAIHGSDPGNTLARAEADAIMAGVLLFLAYQASGTGMSRYAGATDANARTLAARHMLARFGAHQNDDDALWSVLPLVRDATDNSGDIQAWSALLEQPYQHFLTAVDGADRLGGDDTVCALVARALHSAESRQTNTEAQTDEYDPLRHVSKYREQIRAMVEMFYSYARDGAASENQTQQAQRHADLMAHIGDVWAQALRGPTDTAAGETAEHAVADRPKATEAEDDYNARLRQRELILRLQSVDTSAGTLLGILDWTEEDFAYAVQTAQRMFGTRWADKVFAMVNATYTQSVSPEALDRLAANYGAALFTLPYLEAMQYGPDHPDGNTAFDMSVLWLAAMRKTSPSVFKKVVGAALPVLTRLDWISMIAQYAPRTVTLSLDAPPYVTELDPRELVLDFWQRVEKVIFNDA